MKNIEKFFKSWFHFTQLNFWRRLGGWLCLPLFVVYAIAFFAMPFAMPAEIGTADFVGRCVLQFVMVCAAAAFVYCCRMNCVKADLIDRKAKILQNESIGGAYDYERSQHVKRACAIIEFALRR